MARDEISIQIHDPELDADSLLLRVADGVARRRAAGAYGGSVAEAGPESLYPGRNVPVDQPAPAGYPGLTELLAELFAAGRLREPDFASRTPVVGGLLVAVRRAWNWMSTKWYVRPILSQQSDVNARAARLLSDLARWQQTQAGHMLELEARVAELESRLDEMQAGGDG